MVQEKRSPSERSLRGSSGEESLPSRKEKVGMENHPYEVRTTRYYHEPQENTENYETEQSCYEYQKEKSVQEYYEKGLGTSNGSKCIESGVFTENPVPYSLYRHYLHEVQPSFCVSLYC
jgi:hypothetical protein